MAIWNYQVGIIDLKFQQRQITHMSPIMEINLIFSIMPQEAFMYTRKMLLNYRHGISLNELHCN